jgi:hypothetical protein
MSNVGEQTGDAMVEERFVLVSAGDSGKFDVITGYKLNDRPLTRMEANRMAGSGAQSVSAAPPTCADQIEGGVKW